MSYTEINFVAFQVLTAANMNVLGDNDASFNDGTGIANGAVTSEKLTSTVAFLARLTTDQGSVASSTLTTLAAATEVFDTGSDYNTSTYTFTAPYTGVYHFETTIYIDAPGTHNFSAIVVNGSVVAFATEDDDTASRDRGAHVSITVKLTANDTVVAQGFHNAGANRTFIGTSDGSCYFSGFMVGKA